MKRFLLISVFIIGAVSFIAYKASLLPLDSQSEDRIKVEIDSGTSVTQIASLLRAEGVLRFKLGFLAFVRFHKLDSKLQAGIYILQPSLSVPKIVDALQSGKAEEISVTIPEGFTILEIDELLAQKGVIEKGELQDCALNCDFSSFEFLPDSFEMAKRGGKLEGYIYPDTYFVSVKEFVPKFFLERMMTTFKHRIIEKYPEAMLSSVRPFSHVVIMASLIEEETRVDEERAIVSGILWNRLDAEKGLGVDATVRYILDKPTDVLTLVDLSIDSSYNTRKYRGLPPGPIASFSEESFKAALHPEETEYWYYLHGTDRTIHYAETNDEHNANKAKYLR